MNGPMVRMKSPSPGSSTLITSAPSSPNRPAQKGAEIRVPTLGESVTEATVARWLKQNPKVAGIRGATAEVMPEDTNVGKALCAHDHMYEKRKEERYRKRGDETATGEQKPGSDHDSRSCSAKSYET